jgi:ParB family chromosome partitioning protein
VPLGNPDDLIWITADPRGDVSNELVPLSDAERALERASTPADVKELYDFAEAYRTYAKSAEEQNRAASVKLRAAAKGGAMLSADPTLGKGKSARLADLLPGISKDARENVSRRWQRVAALAEAGTLDTYLAAVLEWPDTEISAAGLDAYARHGILTSSESSEWYTPALYVEAVREVLGSIDVDPASSAEANTVVKAARFYDATEDGLAHAWPGAVFCNPPYGPATSRFVAKLRAELDAGHTTAAILLTSAHSTDTDWFRTLWDAAALCFTDHRIAFWAPGRAGSPTFGSVFTYFGSEPASFVTVFEQFGAVVARIQDETPSPLSVYGDLLIDQGLNSDVQLACTVSHWLDYVATRVAPEDHEHWLSSLSQAFRERHLADGTVVPNMSMQWLRGSLAMRLVG